MLGQLAASRRTPHPQIFQRTAETRQFMPLEMADHHHGIGLGDLGGDVHLLKAHAVDGNRCFTAAPQTVGDNQRCAHHRIGKTVCQSRGQVVDGIARLPA
jgi:hypothetical protein